MSDFPARKSPRLKEFDYGSNGAYFVTVCTEGKRHSLCAVGAGHLAGPITELTKFGEIVDDKIRSIPNFYPNVYVDAYVIMPNHIHLLLRIDKPHGPAGCPAPTVSEVNGGPAGCPAPTIGGMNGGPAGCPAPTVGGVNIGPNRNTSPTVGGVNIGPNRYTSSTVSLPKIISALKSLSSREAGAVLWQRGYYEHVCRDYHDYLTRWQYIDDNPGKWAEDEYY